MENLTLHKQVIEAIEPLVQGIFDHFEDLRSGLEPELKLQYYCGEDDVTTVLRTYSTNRKGIPLRQQLSVAPIHKLKKLFDHTEYPFFVFRDFHFAPVHVWRCSFGPPPLENIQLEEVPENKNHIHPYLLGPQPSGFMLSFMITGLADFPLDLYKTDILTLEPQTPINF